MHDKILNQIEDIREIQEELIENRVTLENLKMKLKVLKLIFLEQNLLSLKCEKRWMK